MKRFLRLLAKVFYENRRYVFYCYPDQQQGREGVLDERIKVYDSVECIPSQCREIILPTQAWDPLYYRLKRGDATLLYLADEGSGVKAFGWIQSWVPFRRKFRSFAPDGIMLGPFWTAPEERGKGLYGRLLRHALCLCPKTHPVWIYTSPDNVASQKGIAKAGFVFFGECQVISLCRVVIRRRFIPAGRRDGPRS